MDDNKERKSRQESRISRLTRSRTADEARSAPPLQCAAGFINSVSRFSGRALSFRITGRRDWHHFCEGTQKTISSCEKFLRGARKVSWPLNSLKPSVFRGYLSLWKSQKARFELGSGLNAPWKAKIDLATVSITPDSKRRRFYLQFPKGTQILTPLNKSTYDAWATGLKNHRLFRQEGRTDGGEVSPPLDNSGSALEHQEDNESVIGSNEVGQDNEQSPTNLSSGTKMRDGLDAVTKVMEHTKEIFSNSVDVAISIGRAAEVLNSQTRELKSILQDLRADRVEFAALLGYVIAQKKGGVAEPPTEIAVPKAPPAREPAEEDGADSFEDAKDDTIPGGVTDFLDQKKTQLEQKDDVTQLAQPSIIEPPPPKTFCPERQRRTVLPAKMCPAESLGMGGIARMALSKAGLPISHFEPISMIQALCEELRYYHLLSTAAQCKDPSDRMAFIAAFAVSGYSNTVGRSRKPFNPILGESYEYVDPHWRFHGEQVSHHPPITVGSAEGNGWIWWETMDANSTTNKMTSTVEIKQPSPVRIKLVTPEGDENYSIEKVTTIIERATNPDKRKIAGDVFKGSLVCFRLFGSWDKLLYKVSTTGEQNVLFSAIPAGSDMRDFYGFNQFTVTLNEPPFSDEVVAPTDSRLRPDQRALENGQPQQAAKIKRQLEEAQRQRLRAGPSYPVWFEQTVDPMTKKTLYTSNAKYWTEKEARFAHMTFPVIYS